MLLSLKSVAFFLATLAVCVAKRTVVVSAGWIDGNHADFYIDGSSIYNLGISGAPSSASRGFNLAVVNEINGNIQQITRFDTYASVSESSKLRSFLYSIPFGRIVLISVKDEGSSKLDTITRWVLKQWGGEEIMKFSFRDSWCMVGRTGGVSEAKEQLTKSLSGSASVVSDVKIGTYTMPGGAMVISLFSAGFNDGNYADIFLNGISLHYGGSSSTPSRRGLNIAVINENDATKYDISQIDTFSDSSAMNSLQRLLRSTPYGRIIAIAAKDEASAKFDRYTEWMLEQVGSKKIPLIGFRDSWCLIGRVGARSDYAEIQEDHKVRSKGFAETKAILRPPIALPAQPRHTADISVYSSGFDDGNKADIYINGKSIFSFSSTHPSAPGRGLNVAVLNQETGALVAFRNFDTHALSGDTPLQAFLRRLVNGRIVIITIMDEASSRLSDGSKTLLKGLGSARVTDLRYRMGWCMIGRVNAGSNSAVEDFAARTSGPAICRDSYFRLL